MKTFQSRLTELRIEKRLSQVELSKATGLSSGAISFWEAGKRVPNANAVIILAKYFNVSTDYLLGVKDWE